MAFTDKQKTRYCLNSVDYCAEADVYDNQYALEFPQCAPMTYGDFWRDDILNAIEYIKYARSQGIKIDQSVVFESLHEQKNSAVGQKPIVRAMLKCWVE